MSRKFKLKNNYYDEGKLYQKSNATIKQGVTVLVGCNGIGKTTFLKQLKEDLKSKNIPCIMFNNLTDGGSKSVSEAGFYGDFSFMATAMCSSEGENIVMNMGKLATRLGSFVKTGIDPKEKKYFELAQSIARLHGEDINDTEIPKERWILLDAVDSGLSVDNIVDLKEQLFQTILKYNFDNDVYILISANEYEMARNEQCFDVYNMEYVIFKDYEGYRNFVLKSKELKNRSNGNE